MLPPSLHSITREAEKSMLTVTNILHCCFRGIYKGTERQICVVPRQALCVQGNSGNMQRNLRKLFL